MLKSLPKWIIGFVLLSFASLSSQTVVKIVPAQTGPVTVGQNIDLQVRIQNYTNLHGYSVVLLFNKAAVNLRSPGASQGTIFSGFQTFFGAPSFADSLKVDAAILGVGGVSGADGLAFTAYFQTVGTGGTDVRFILSKLRGVSNNELPHSREDAVITVNIPLPDNSFTEAFKSTDFPGEVAYGNTKAKLDFNYTSGGGTVTIMHYETQPPGGNSAPFNADPLVTSPVVGPRYWEVTSSISQVGGTNFSANLTFSYAGLPGISDPGKLGIGRRSLGAGAGGTWDIFNYTEVSINQGSQEITLQGPLGSGLYTAGQYTILSDLSDNSLPVTLTSFTARVTAANFVELNWTTESEINNLGFYVERRAEGGEFTPLAGGFVPGQGNSNQSHDYSYEDRTVTPGNWYYRLKQVDFNGDFEYSEEVFAKVEQGTVISGFELRQNYPNPFNPRTAIQFAIPAGYTGEIRLQVFDASGKPVKTLARGAWSPGTHTVEWNGTNEAGQAAASGVYYYVLKTGSLSLSKKMVFLR